MYFFAELECNMEMENRVFCIEFRCLISTFCNLLNCKFSYQNVDYIYQIMFGFLINRHLRDKLLDAHEFEIARAISTKHRLEIGPVFYAWGLHCLHIPQPQTDLLAARDKLSHCLKVLLLKLFSNNFIPIRAHEFSWRFVVLDHVAPDSFLNCLGAHFCLRLFLTIILNTILILHVLYTSSFLFISVYSNRPITSLNGLRSSQSMNHCEICALALSEN